VGFVAVASLVARLGGSNAAYAVAGVMIARTLPSVLFGPLAGVIVDRVNRKKLMITADVARGALYASMPLLDRLWAIYVMSFAIECLSLVWTPAKDSTLPNLVPRRQLVNANTVGVASIEMPQLLRVAPSDPSNSYLYRKITGAGITGDRMPQGGPYLTDAQIKLVRDWIRRGAPND
jgi:MFS family permease